MPPIGTLLVEAGEITEKQLDEALQCQVLFGGSIGTNLLELGYVSESALARGLGHQLGVPAPSLSELEKIPDPIIDLLPAPLAEELCAVPVRRERGTLVLAMADPRDKRAITQVRETTGFQVQPAVVPEARMAWLLEKYYDVRREQRYVNVIRSMRSAEKPAPVPEMPPASIFEEPKAPVTHPEVEPAEKPVGRMSRTGAEARRPSRSISPAELDEMLAGVRTRDDVAQVILSYAQNFVRRACLLVVKRDTAYGWAGYGEGISPAAVRGIMIPLSQPSVFRTVKETQAPFLGPISETPVSRRFLAAFGGAEPQTIVTVPIAYGGNLIAIFYGDNGADRGVPPRHVPELKLLSDKVALAFRTLIENLRAGRPGAAGGAA